MNFQTFSISIEIGVWRRHKYRYKVLKNSQSPNTVIEPSISETETLDAVQNAPNKGTAWHPTMMRSQTLTNIAQGRVTTQSGRRQSLNLEIRSQTLTNFPKSRYSGRQTGGEHRDAFSDPHKHLVG